MNFLVRNIFVSMKEFFNQKDMENLEENII